MKNAFLFVLTTAFLACPGQIWAQQQSTLEALAAGRMNPSQLDEAAKDQLLMELSRRLLAAESAIKRLEQQLTNANNAAKVKEAQSLFAIIQNLHTEMKFAEMRQKMKELETKIPEVRQAKAFTDLEVELGYIGREAGDLMVEKWFQGETHYENAKVTLLVFFETWCPHCQDEMPRIELMHKTFAPQGLEVVGLTKVSETATEESVYGFITEHAVSFPVAKVTETFAGRYGVDTVPAAVIIKSGKIVWRGKPDRIAGKTIEMVLSL